ncbi:MAG: hypothetical protein IJM57_02815 [Lachnospiraceae bacterium]|nr:hypothetical protein [Lachnospiraceae bacterium]
MIRRNQWGNWLIAVCLILFAVGLCGGFAQAEEAAQDAEYHLYILFAIVVFMELFLLALFQIPLVNRNLLYFVIVNVILYIPVAFFVPAHMSKKAVLSLIGFEFLITGIIKAGIFMYTLRDVNGGKYRFKGFVYGFTANPFGWMFGLYMYKLADKKLPIAIVVFAAAALFIAMVARHTRAIAKERKKETTNG